MVLVNSHVFVVIIFYREFKIILLLFVLIVSSHRCYGTFLAASSMWRRRIRSSFRILYLGRIKHFLPEIAA